MFQFMYFRQLEAMDCGPACLKMICHYYGKEISMQELREKSSFRPSGVNMLDLCKAAKSLGFKTLVVAFTMEKLIKNTVLPCIVYYYNHHFVVVYEISFEKSQTFIHVADPASGKKKYAAEEFQKGYLTLNKNGLLKGYSLMLEPVA